MSSMFDRTGYLFDDQTIRDDLEQALKAADKFRPGQLAYLDGGPFSGAVQIAVDALDDIDLEKLAESDRRMVEGVRALAKHFKLGGYAMAHARAAGDHARSDWPELVAYVQQHISNWAEQVDHDGPRRCRLRIVDRCTQLLERGDTQEDQDDGYAMLRHLASCFSASDGFRPGWQITT